MGHNQKTTNRTTLMLRIGTKAEDNAKAIEALEKKLRKEHQHSKDQRLELDRRMASRITASSEKFLGQLGEAADLLHELNAALELHARPWYRKLNEWIRGRLGRKAEPITIEPIEPTESELNLLKGRRYSLDQIVAAYSPRAGSPERSRDIFDDALGMTEEAVEHQVEALELEDQAEHPTIGALEDDLKRLRGELDNAGDQVANLELEELTKEFEHELATARDLWEDQVLDKEERNKLLDETLIRAEVIKTRIQQLRIEASGIRRVRNR
jgi:hypothetical protein